MKKSIFTLVLGLLVSGMAIAQVNPGHSKENPLHLGGPGASKIAKENITPEQIAKRQTENMKRRLELTADQEKTVYELNLKFAKEQSAIRENMITLRKQMLKNAKDKDSLIKNVLTPDQRKFQALYQELNRERMKNRMQGQGRELIRMNRMKNMQNMQNMQKMKEMQMEKMKNEKTK
jgi:hypothetical protein